MSSSLQKRKREDGSITIVDLSDFVKQTDVLGLSPEFIEGANQSNHTAPKPPAPKPQVPKKHKAKRKAPDPPPLVPKKPNDAAPPPAPKPQVPKPPAPKPQVPKPPAPKPQVPKPPAPKQPRVPSQSKLSAKEQLKGDLINATSNVSGPGSYTQMSPSEVRALATSCIKTLNSDPNATAPWPFSKTYLLEELQKIICELEDSDIQGIYMYGNLFLYRTDITCEDPTFCWKKFPGAFQVHDYLIVTDDPTQALLAGPPRAGDKMSTTSVSGNLNCTIKQWVSLDTVLYMVPLNNIDDEGHVVFDAEGLQPRMRVFVPEKTKGSDYPKKIDLQLEWPEVLAVVSFVTESCYPGADTISGASGINSAASRWTTLQMASMDVFNATNKDETHIAQAKRCQKSADSVLNRLTRTLKDLPKLSATTVATVDSWHKWAKNQGLKIYEWEIIHASTQACVQRIMRQKCEGGEVLSGYFELFGLDQRGFSVQNLKAIQTVAESLGIQQFITAGRDQASVRDHDAYKKAGKMPNEISMECMEVEPDDEDDPEELNDVATQFEMMCETSVEDFLVLFVLQASRYGNLDQKANSAAAKSLMKATDFPIVHFIAVARVLLHLLIKCQLQVKFMKTMLDHIADSDPDVEALLKQAQEKYSCNCTPVALLDKIRDIFFDVLFGEKNPGLKLYEKLYELNQNLNNPDNSYINDPILTTLHELWKAVEDKNDDLMALLKAELENHPRLDGYKLRENIMMHFWVLLLVSEIAAKLPFMPATSPSECVVMLSTVGSVDTKQDEQSTLCIRRTTEQMASMPSKENMKFVLALTGGNSDPNPVFTTQDIRQLAITQTANNTTAGFSSNHVPHIEAEIPGDEGEITDDEEGAAAEGDDEFLSGEESDEEDGIEYKPSPEGYSSDEADSNESNEEPSDEDSSEEDSSEEEIDFSRNDYRCNNRGCRATGTWQEMYKHERNDCQYKK
jgi:hypothetical protein